MRTVPGLGLPVCAVGLGRLPEPPLPHDEHPIFIYFYCTYLVPLQLIQGVFGLRNMRCASTLIISSD